MDLSGLRETISTRGKIFPARSRIVGSVNGKSIIVPRIGPLGRAAKRPNRTINAAQSEKARARGRGSQRGAAAGQFQLQKELISERMPLTAEATVSRLGWARIPD